MVKYDWKLDTFKGIKDGTDLPDDLFVYACLESVTADHKGVLVVHPQIPVVYSRSNIVVALQSMKNSSEFIFEKFQIVLFPVKKETSWSLFALRRAGNNTVNIYLFDPCKKGEEFWKPTKEDIVRLWKVICFKQNPSLRKCLTINNRNATNMKVSGDVEDNSTGFVIPSIAKYFIDQVEFPKTLKFPQMKQNVFEMLVNFDKERSWRKKSKHFWIISKYLLLWDGNSCHTDVLIVPLYFFCQKQIEDLKENSPIRETLKSIFTLMREIKEQNGKKITVGREQMEPEEIKKRFSILKKQLFMEIHDGRNMDIEWGQPNEPTFMMNCFKLSCPKLEIFKFAIWRERICSGCERHEREYKECGCTFGKDQTDCFCHANPKIVSNVSVGGHIESEDDMFREFELCTTCNLQAKTLTFLNRKVDFFFFEFPLKVKHFFPTIQVPIRGKASVTYKAVYAITQPYAGHFSSSWNKDDYHTEYDGIKDPNVKQFAHKWDPKGSSFILYKKSD